MDWTGNKSSAFSCIGAVNYRKGDRQIDDYYATEPLATRLLLERETFSKAILEPACGGGHMSEVLKEHGYIVVSSDLVDRGYKGTVVKDFFEITSCEGMDIITNPPYKYAAEFVEHSLDIQRTGGKVAMFLKLTFLEGKARKKLFEKYPFKTLYVSSGRLHCGKNGNFVGVGNAVAYGWYVWEKGFTGKPCIEWI